MASHDVPIGSTQVSLAALNERSREIFRSIVESYLTTGEPVGSRNLARILPIALSPDTGFIVSPPVHWAAVIVARPEAMSGRGTDRIDRPPRSLPSL